MYDRNRRELIALLASAGVAAWSLAARAAASDAEDRFREWGSYIGLFALLAIIFLFGSDAAICPCARV
jgi:hypothetical protein